MIRVLLCGWILWVLTAEQVARPFGSVSSDNPKDHVKTERVWKAVGPYETKAECDDFRKMLPDRTTACWPAGHRP
jgi:hypothetical protein